MIKNQYEIFIYLIFVGLIIIGCKKSNENPSSQNIDSETISKSQDCIPYFEFDEVEYYHINIEESEVFDLLETESKNDSVKFSIISEDKLSVLSDSKLIQKLTDFGYSKNEIPSTDFSNLNKIFCSENYSFLSATACTPFYRDVLVFRKSKKVPGIVKLCFDCSQSTLANKKGKLKSLYFRDKKWNELNNLLSKYRKQ